MQSSGMLSRNKELFERQSQLINPMQPVLECRL